MKNGLHIDQIFLPLLPAQGGKMGRGAIYVCALHAWFTTFHADWGSNIAIRRTIAQQLGNT